MKHKKEDKKAIVKTVTLTTVILTILFIVLAIIYQTTASHRHLTDDLNTVFSNPKK